MQKIGDSTNTADAEGEYTGGNPGAGVDATRLTAPWLNAIQRELIAVITGAGIALDASKDDQVLSAIAEFVQRARGNISGGVAVNTSIALGAAHCGATIELYGSVALTIAMPLTSVVGGKAAIKIVNLGTVNMTLATQGADTFLVAQTNPATLVLLPGDTVELNSFNGWVVVGGSYALKFAASFAGSLEGLICSQRLPSGDIEQWGIYSGAPSGANVVITLPVTMVAQATNVELTFADTGANIAVGQAPVLQVYGNTLGSLTVRNLHSAPASFFWKVRGRV